ncbi:hypothetical protein AC579_3291 [Pseudocercospora musae]|uniref:Uncharacterized protein n=1 Tax=Pseudocercospora musae TaxID=113226 RepID=A0A139IDK2_9PEZI|nr:hypothetical protein AC579_3291 [Pseudocercospora musae]
MCRGVANPGLWPCSHSSGAGAGAGADTGAGAGADAGADADADADDVQPLAARKEGLDLEAD